MTKDEPKQHSISGYSQVEFMIVVGALGLGALLAIPRFRQFERKAKMAEARGVLQHIATLEKSYELTHKTYIDFGPLGANLSTLAGRNRCSALNDEGAARLGYSIEACVESSPIPRYAYRVSGASRERFVASAMTGSFEHNRFCKGNDQHYLALNQNNIHYGLYASDIPQNRSDLAELSPETACPLD